MPAALGAAVQEYIKYGRHISGLLGPIFIGWFIYNLKLGPTKSDKFENWKKKITKNKNIFSLALTPLPLRNKGELMVLKPNYIVVPKLWPRSDN